MSKPASNKGQKTKPWWRTSRGRNKAWFGLFGVLAAFIVGGFVWLSLNGTNTGDGSEPVGQQVEPFQLPDIVSGRDFSIADYLGKQEIVVVGYMGFF